MTDIVVDTLRLRGSHARRLARVAARALPPALERALADLEDVEVGAVRVVLDLDPAEYDDDTLAVLWADLIRAELIGQGVGTLAPDRSVGRSDPDAEAPVQNDDLVATARAWLAIKPEARSVPAALLSLGDAAVAVRLAAELGTDDWRRLVTSLRRTLAGGTNDDRHEASTATAKDAPLTGRHRAPTPSLDDRPEPDRPVADHGAPAGDRAGDEATSPDLLQATLAEAHDVLADLQTLRELHAGALTPLDPAAISRAAGLVLLYPWLGDHCRYAEELHPGLDQYDVREAALAELVADPAAADDPLVRLLAGRPEPWTGPARERIDLPHRDDVAHSAERVLASFASLLPGFERSTPGFVRDAWLVRTGVLDADRSPVLLTAATHPLDVLLPMLPYPVGLMRLPWSVPLSVRFRP